MLTMLNVIVMRLMRRWQQETYSTARISLMRWSLSFANLEIVTTKKVSEIVRTVSLIGQQML